MTVESLIELLKSQDDGHFNGINIASTGGCSWRGYLFDSVPQFVAWFTNRKRDPDHGTNDIPVRCDICGVVPTRCMCNHTGNY